MTSYKGYTANEQGAVFTNVGRFVVCVGQLDKYQSLRDWVQSYEFLSN